MKIGFVGLGRMGKAMVEHLLESGVDVVVYNRTQEKSRELSAHIKNLKFKIKNYGELYIAETLQQFIGMLEHPRIVWFMVPHGDPVDEMIEKLLEVGIGMDDIVIDGGNSFYKDSIRRYQLLKSKGIHFLDIGTSGGLEGARNGACLMIGGDQSIYAKVRPLLEVIAKPKGIATYFGEAGAGHFVKMVHNGVEYGMLQSIGEGFEMLENGPYKLDLHAISQNWTKGSVVRGWLMDLLEKALVDDPHLDSIEGVVGGGETGEWTVETAKEEKVATPVISASLQARKDSSSQPTFAGKIVAALRNQFGGHEVHKLNNPKSEKG